jgi:hypothetical protein
MTLGASRDASRHSAPERSPGGLPVRRCAMQRRQDELRPARINLLLRNGVRQLQERFRNRLFRRRRMMAPRGPAFVTWAAQCRQQVRWYLTMRPTMEVAIFPPAHCR